ncbi:MAG: PEGA domain-containing protein [Polyangiaceae bacterium]|nr:PEGA domain-containing protein [Polyangiaceae bacterium]
MRFFACAVGLALASGFVRDAAADQKRAARLFDEALELADANRWDAACPKFRESLEAEASVGAQLNVAKCSERAGLLLQAEREYGALIELNESTRDRDRKLEVEARAKEALKSLERRIPRVVVKVMPASAEARVLVDGNPPASTAPNGAVRVDPGLHKLRAEASAFEAAEEVVTLKEGEERIVELTLARVPIERVGPEARPADFSLVGWVSSGAGLAVAAAGAAMLGVASMRASEIEDACGRGAAPPRCSGGAANAARANELSEEGTALEIGGFSLLGVGGAALATGIVILAVDASSKPSPSTGAIVLPVIGAHEGGLWVRGAF